MKKLVLIIIAAAALPLQAQNKDKQAEEELANVGIFRFDNLSHKPDYNWLADSLPAAVHKSMQDRFEYRRPTPDKNQKIIDKESKKWKAQKATAPQGKDRLKKMCDLTGSHMLIVGEFKESKNKKSITITASIYHKSADKEFGKVVEKAPINDKLFKATDKVAAKIVKHIYDFVVAQQKLAAAEGETTAKKNDGERLAISRKAKQESSLTHSVKLDIFGIGLPYSLNYLLGFNLGSEKFYTEAGLAVAPLEDGDKSVATIHLQFGWLFWDNMYAALGFEYVEFTETVDNNKESSSNIVTAFTLGYRYYILEQLSIDPSATMFWYMVNSEPNFKPWGGLGLTWHF